MTDTDVAVVTGPSSGLGRALVQAFLEKGLTVVGVGRREPESPSSGDCAAYFYIRANVSDALQVMAAFEEIRAVHGRVDILFNNAAIYPKVNFLEESAEAFADALATNLGGVANCCKAALPLMIQQGRGRIYNVGSWADVAPISHSAVYAASKGGLHALTKGIAADTQHIQADLQIHEWIPGHMNTRMSEFTGMDPRICADWAVDIVRRDDASARSCIFMGDREWRPPEPLRLRIKKRMLFWRSTIS